MSARLLLLLCALGVGCAPADVVVASLPPGPDGGHPPPHPPCGEDRDCPPGSFCEKPGCEAPFGRCQRPPVLCDPAAQPVCGCNGVTYWNDCLRRMSAVTASTLGECEGGASCGLHPCPDPSASCARLLPPGTPCGPAPPGSCWVLPPTCPPPPPGAFSYRACGSVACSEVCGAIRSGLPHHRVPSCQ